MRLIFTQALAAAVLASSLVASLAAAADTPDPLAKLDRHVEVPGTRLWVVNSGGVGEPVVVLHANTGTTASWKHQIVTFSKVGYRVIAPDRREWGKSLPDTASVLQPGPQPGIAAEELDVLSNRLALGKFHLVAVAGGGFKALDQGISMGSDPGRGAFLGVGTARFVQRSGAGFSSQEFPYSADFTFLHSMMIKIMKLTAFQANRLAMLGIVLSALAACGHTGNSATATLAPRVTDAVITVQGNTVPYTDSGGAGVPAVFLHAASGKSRMWEYQIPAYVAAGFRFIAIDWRHPVPGSPVGSNSSRIIDAVLSQLGITHFHVVGTAAGGGAAFQYALEHPQKIRSLIIANSIGAVTDEAYLEMSLRLRPVPQFNALPVEFRELGPSYRAGNPQGAARWKALAYPFVPSTPGKPFAETVAGAKPVVAPLMPGPNVAVTWAKLETLKMPVLLLTGDADLYTPPSVLRLFKARIKHAETMIVAETGHSAFWEQPEIFNRVTLDFLRRH
jgi:pimeloyl-ACP methyl ester carboxylesterase